LLDRGPAAQRAAAVELLAIARKDQQWKDTAHFNFSRRKKLIVHVG
jgi:hypothetical protein